MYLGMKDVESCPTNHEKSQEKSQYGSDNKHISMWVVSVGIVEDDARKSFNKFTLPPCMHPEKNHLQKPQRFIWSGESQHFPEYLQSSKEQDSSLQQQLESFYAWSQIYLHTKKLILKSKASGMQPALAIPVVQILLASFFSGVRLEYH
jgi:hypothetical protein